MVNGPSYGRYATGRTGDRETLLFCVNCGCYVHSPETHTEVCLRNLQGGKLEDLVAAYEAVKEKTPMLENLLQEASRHHMIITHVMIPREYDLKNSADEPFFLSLLGLPIKWTDDGSWGITRLLVS